MEHSMKLLDGPFKRISSGKKTVEVRLFDEKRQRLNVGDTIVFSKLPDLTDKLKVEIIALLRYASFKELVSDFGVEHFGYPKDYPVSRLVDSIHSIYPEEKEKQFGVLGIKIKLLSIL